MSKPYGFNNEYSGYTSQIHALAHEVLDVDVHALENSTPDERRLFYKMREEEHFDPEHYM